MIPWIGAGLVGMDKVGAPIFGYESLTLNGICSHILGHGFEAFNGIHIASIWITIIIVLPLLTVYVWSSGLGGVLITDGMQGIVIIIGNLVLVVAVLMAFGGPTGMGSALKSAYSEKNITELRSMVASDIIDGISGRRRNCATCRISADEKRILRRHPRRRAGTVRAEIHRRRRK